MWSSYSTIGSRPKLISLAFNYNNIKTFIWSCVQFIWKFLEPDTKEAKLFSSIAEKHSRLCKVTLWALDSSEDSEGAVEHVQAPAWENFVLVQPGLIWLPQIKSVFTKLLFPRPATALKDVRMYSRWKFLRPIADLMIQALGNGIQWGLWLVKLTGHDKFKCALRAVVLNFAEG